MKNLKKKKGIFTLAKFDMSQAKGYIIATLIMFHIVPLIFVCMGEMGQTALMTMFMFMVNPMMVFGIGLFYGVRIGFEWKFPLISGILSAASVPMYYNFPDINYLILSTLICFIVYTIFAYVFVFCGAIVKKIIAGE